MIIIRHVPTVFLLDSASPTMSEEEQDPSTYSTQCDDADDNARRDTSFIGPTRGGNLGLSDDRLLGSGLTGGSYYDSTGLGDNGWRIFVSR